MIRSVAYLALAALTACAHTPPPANTIMREPISVECPEPDLRMPPPALSQALGLEAPAILPAGQGDYGISRVDLERMIEALRRASSRVAQWRAWATGMAPKVLPSNNHAGIGHRAVREIFGAISAPFSYSEFE